MQRIAMLLVLGLPFAMASAGCSDDCHDPFDCKSGEVCYRDPVNGARRCRSAANANLQCNSDNDCGPDPGAGMMRPFSCIVGLCTPSGPPPFTIPDSGPLADIGFLDALPNADALPNLDAMTMDATATTADAGTSTITDGGLADTGTVAGAG